MRNLLVLAALAVLILAGVGYYRGWYTIKETTAPEGHHGFSVDVDTHKIKDDVNKEKQEIGEILRKK